MSPALASVGWIEAERVTSFGLMKAELSFLFGCASAATATEGGDVATKVKANSVEAASAWRIWQGRPKEFLLMASCPVNPGPRAVATARSTSHTIVV
jgi:hypothetical protein